MYVNNILQSESIELSKLPILKIHSESHCYCYNVALDLKKICYMRTETVRLSAVEGKTTVEFKAFSGCVVCL